MATTMSKQIVRSRMSFNMTGNYPNNKRSTKLLTLEYPMDRYLSSVNLFIGLQSNMECNHNRNL